jgi:hypothetical protein
VIALLLPGRRKTGHPETQTGRRETVGA